MRQVHIGIIIRIDGSDITPIGLGLAIFVVERKREHAIGMNDARNDVFAKIMDTAGIVGVPHQLFK